MTSYNSFARFYDGLMEDADYKNRCEYILALAKKHNHEMGITLDLACGTGSLTRELAKNGIDVYGIDASAEMLCEAMQKNSEEGLNILYLRQKMQNLDLYGTIDTCVCTLDSINHVTNISDVAKAFDSFRAGITDMISSAGTLSETLASIFNFDEEGSWWDKLLKKSEGE